MHPRQSGGKSNNYSYTVWYSNHLCAHQRKTICLKEPIKPPHQMPAQEAQHNSGRKAFLLHVTSLNLNHAGLPSKSMYSHLLLSKKKILAEGTLLPSSRPGFQWRNHWYPQPYWPFPEIITVTTTSSTKDRVRIKVFSWQNWYYSSTCTKISAETYNWSPHGH